MSERGMYSVQQVANWFLQKEPMDQKKLQKICYFAYAWYLYFCNEIEDGLNNRLFKNDIQGWVHGPVSYELYRTFPFKGIETLYPKSGYATIPDDDKGTISILEDVYEAYNQYTGNELEIMTHQQEPWLESRKGLKPYEPGHELLKDETIFNYFTRLANSA